MPLGDFWSWLGNEAGQTAASLLPRQARVWAARKLINQRIGRYGEMTELRIDRDGKTIEATLTLVGEKEPITVRVGQYEFTEAGSVRLSQVSVSREWMHRLAQDLVADKEWPVPEAAAKWLRVVL
jgi:hypothetical protein